MNQIKATKLLHSITPWGEELITYRLVFPRIILAELNTHRMFSRNTSSSRAIPFEKMVETVSTNPFIPIAWQKQHKGMQGNEYFTNEEIQKTGIIEQYLGDRDFAVSRARALSEIGVTKQLCNRLLEPFMWSSVLLTTGFTGLSNFFELRSPKYFGIYNTWEEAVEKEGGDINTPFELRPNTSQAEIHLQVLAESMLTEYRKSLPQKLQEGEWHIPYKSEILSTITMDSEGLVSELLNEQDLIKISTALAAKESYTVINPETKLDIPKLKALHDKLISQKHSSPLEHCARVMRGEERCHYYVKSERTQAVGEVKFTHPCRNFEGFIQYRHLVEKGLWI